MNEANEMMAKEPMNTPESVRLIESLKSEAKRRNSYIDSIVGRVEALTGRSAYEESKNNLREDKPDAKEEKQCFLYELRNMLNGISDDNRTLQAIVTILKESI